MVTTGNFKKCERGHFYSAELDHCPYCPSNGFNNSDETMDGGKTSDFDSFKPKGGNVGAYQGNANSGTKTEIIGGFGNGSQGNNDKTRTNDGYAGGSDNNETTDFPNRPKQAPQQPASNRTMMFDEDPGNGMYAVIRERRKLVGWLVSYTLDPMGVTTVH